MIIRCVNTSELNTALDNAQCNDLIVLDYDMSKTMYQNQFMANVAMAETRAKEKECKLFYGYADMIVFAKR